MPGPAPPGGTSTVDLDLGRMRDLRGRVHHPWVRRAVVTAMVLLIVVALTGRLGQSERTRAARSGAAEVTLAVPSTLRGGLLWSARVTVRARTRIVEPDVVLGAGYVRGMQLNTVEPAPADESTRGRSLVFTYATLDAGDELTLTMQLQVDPDTVGRQDLSVVLQPGGDDPAPPVRLPASTTVLP